MNPPVNRLPWRSSGFTLLEVLVALAVLAISLGAVLRLAGGSTVTVSYLQERTVAGWVASNVVNQLILEAAWPEPGGSRGRVEMVRREWRWQLTVTDTDDPDLRRLEVTVSALNGEDDSQALTRLIAFIGRPAP